MNNPALGEIEIEIEIEIARGLSILSTSMYIVCECVYNMKYCSGNGP